MSKRECERGRRVPLRARLRDAFRAASAQCSRIELQSRRCMVVHGCSAIESYDQECIVLGVRDPHVRAVSISGRALHCSSYHSDAVVVEGEIAKVQFLCDK